MAGTPSTLAYLAAAATAGALGHTGPGADNCHCRVCLTRPTTTENTENS
ncbi:hypothetical protein [Nocardia cerradoensis]|uniref:Uncharacterized protein n=1 Tax=Nocardia cerradoensis TaxID=85688 RepID=A0A231GSY6_9NOCA|nr:hypothetical protein [Nocardia cerradoensis]NKY47984.1 hypothetical protein [Nocardia cerradoensis]OXR39665.1 hypothetical protein B7C42_08270 [Nocardia cerradoensis]